MNRRTVVTCILCMVAGLILMAVAAIPALLLKKWVAVAISVALSAAALTVYIIANKRHIPALCLVTLLLNSAGCGIAAAAYYIHSGISPLDPVVLLAGAAAFVFASLVTLLIWVLKKKAVVIAALILVLLSLAGTAVLWAAFDGVFYSALFFMLLFASFFIFAPAVAESQEKDAPPVEAGITAAALTSFGAYIAVLLIVLLILSDGDIADGIDFDIGTGGKNGKK